MLSRKIKQKLADTTGERRVISSLHFCVFIVLETNAKKSTLQPRIRVLLTQNSRFIAHPNERDEACKLDVLSETCIICPRIDVLGLFVPRHTSSDRRSGRRNPFSGFPIRFCRLRGLLGEMSIRKDLINFYFSLRLSESCAPSAAFYFSIR